MNLGQHCFVSARASTLAVLVGPSWWIRVSYLSCIQSNCLSDSHVTFCGQCFAIPLCCDEDSTNSGLTQVRACSVGRGEADNSANKFIRKVLSIFLYNECEENISVPICPPLTQTRLLTAIRYLTDHFVKESQCFGLEANSRSLHNVHWLSLRGVESLTGLQIDLAQLDKTGLVVELVAKVAAKERHDANVI
jgi:hypothetical protein